MGGLSISNDLLIPITCLQSRISAFTNLQSTLHKVILVAILILGVGLITTAQWMLHSQCANLVPSHPVSALSSASRSEPTISERQITQFEPGQEFPLLKLPPELLVHTFSFLKNPKDLITLGLVSQEVLKVAFSDDLWKPLVIDQWGKSAEEEGKSWKQIYQENYEGPPTHLTNSCQVQSFQGEQEVIPYGEQSRATHLKRRICQRYNYPPGTIIHLLARGEEVQDSSWVKDFAYNKTPYGAIPCVINFTIMFPLR